MHTRTTTIALLLGCLWLAQGCTAETEPSLALQVERSALVFEGSYLGEFQATNSVPIHVPNIADTQRLTIDSVEPDGTRIRKGDVILTFVRDTLEADLLDDQNKRDVAEAQRRKVAQDLERERIELELQVQRRELELKRAELQIVQGVNFISELELQKAQLDADRSKIELQLSKKALQTFQKKKTTALRVETLKVQQAERAVTDRTEGLGQIEVTAPVDGVVFAPYTRLNWSRTKALPGVVARPGDKVLEIPDLTKFELHVYIRQRDATLIQIGDKATVTPTILPDKEIQGTVQRKDDFATTRNTRFGTETAEGNLKEYLVVIGLDESSRELRPGNTAKVTIRSVLAEDAVIVPIPAVLERGGRYVVQQPNGNEVPIEVGRTNVTHAEVTAGLTPGDLVIVPSPDERTTGSQQNP